MPSFFKYIGNWDSGLCAIVTADVIVHVHFVICRNHIVLLLSEMHGYHFLISVCYRCPLKTMRIRIPSVQTLLTAIRIRGSITARFSWWEAWGLLTWGH